jgi:hypothetical protein
MSNEEIQIAIVDVLREVQTISGRQWIELGAGEKPIGALEGFDSLSGVEATVMIEQRLGGNGLEIESMFVSDDGKHALTVAEIASRIGTIMRTKRTGA